MEGWVEDWLEYEKLSVGEDSLRIGLIKRPQDLEEKRLSDFDLFF